jgi:hypothetical protein
MPRNILPSLGGVNVKPVRLTLNVDSFASILTKVFQFPKSAQINAR